MVLVFAEEGFCVVAYVYVAGCCVVAFSVHMLRGAVPRGGSALWLMYSLREAVLLPSLYICCGMFCCCLVVFKRNPTFLDISQV